MRITEVYVDGFKNIVDTRIKFNDVTCLISPNNFGKSNLLKAIMNGFAFIRSTSNDNRRFFSQRENMPFLKTMQEKPYSFEIVLNDETKAISYGFSYNWDTGGHGYGMVTEEHLKVKESGARKPRTYLLRNHPMRCRYLISSHSSSMDQLDVPVDQLAFAWLARTKKVFFSGILEAIASCSMYIDYGNDPISSLVLSIPDKVQPYVVEDSLENVLCDFFMTDPHNKMNLVEAMKSMFPDVIDIAASSGVVQLVNGIPTFERRVPFPGETRTSVVYVRLKNYERPLSLKLMSSGFVRILFFLINLFQAQKRDGILLAFEEPENAIHPGLLANFVEHIKVINERAAIILSSHSPFIANSIDPTAIYVGLPNENGTASFAPFKKSKEKAMSSGASDFGLTMGSYIFELLGGDDYLKSMLASYLEK